MISENCKVEINSFMRKMKEYEALVNECSNISEKMRTLNKDKRKEFMEVFRFVFEKMEKGKNRIPLCPLYPEDKHGNSGTKAKPTGYWIVIAKLGFRSYYYSNGRSKAKTSELDFTNLIRVFTQENADLIKEKYKNSYDDFMFFWDVYKKILTLINKESDDDDDNDEKYGILAEKTLNIKGLISDSWRDEDNYEAINIEYIKVKYGSYPALSVLIGDSNGYKSIGSKGWKSLLFCSEVVPEAIEVLKQARIALEEKKSLEMKRYEQIDTDMAKYTTIMKL